MNLFKLVPLIVIISICLLGCSTTTPDPYKILPITEVYSQLIERSETDLLHSGVIASESGLSTFRTEYGIGFNAGSIAFDKQMLVFGITDEITSRAFRLLKPQAGTYCLDYRAHAVKYKIKKADPGNKNSYLQIFTINRIEGLSRIDVKNIVRGMATKRYE